MKRLLHTLKVTGIVLIMFIPWPVLLWISTLETPHAPHAEIIAECGEYFGKGECVAFELTAKCMWEGDDQVIALPRVFKKPLRDSGCIE